MTYDERETEQSSSMPDQLYVFNDPRSIGDLGFTRTDAQDGHDKYHHDRKYAAMVSDYEDVLKDKRRLVREIDVILNGDKAAPQASLCDIVEEIRALKASHDRLFACLIFCKPFIEDGRVGDKRHRYDKQADMVIKALAEAEKVSE